MDRRSFLVSLLLAPFAWLARKFGAKPDRVAFKGGDFRLLEHPVLFERGQPFGIITEPFELHRDLPNEAPFSKTLEPEWSFPEGSVYWRIEPEPYLFKLEAREVDVRLRGVRSSVTLYDSIKQTKRS